MPAPATEYATVLYAWPRKTLMNLSRIIQLGFLMALSLGAQYVNNGTGIGGGGGGGAAPYTLCASGCSQTVPASGTTITAATHKQGPMAQMLCVDSLLVHTMPLRWGMQPRRQVRWLLEISRSRMPSPRRIARLARRAARDRREQRGRLDPPALRDQRDQRDQPGHPDSTGATGATGAAGAWRRRD